MIEDLPNEIWRNIPIEDLSDKYAVSNKNRIKSLRRICICGNPPHERIVEERIMKLKLDKDGYQIVCLRNNGKAYYLKVHRLVAMAFIPNPLNLPMINHKDENKQNNIPENLEWCDAKYNTNYGTNRERAKRFGKDHANSKPILQIDPNTNEVIREWESIRQVERELGYSHGNIWFACNFNKVRYNSKWKYKEEG